MPKLSLSRAWEEAKASSRATGACSSRSRLALFVLPRLILSVSMPVAEAGKLPPAGWPA